MYPHRFVPDATWGSFMKAQSLLIPIAIMLGCGIAICPAEAQIPTSTTTPVQTIGPTGSTLSSLSLFGVSFDSGEPLAFFPNTPGSNPGVMNPFTAPGNVLGGPSGVAIDSLHGTVVVADEGIAPNVATPAAPSNGQIVVYDIATGSLLRKFGAGILNDPTGIAVDASGNVFVADNLNNQIVVFDFLGNVLQTFQPTIQQGGSFMGPAAVALTGTGSLFVADSHGVPAHPTASVRAFSLNGATIGSQSMAISMFQSTALVFPEGVAVDSSGNIWITDPNAPAVDGALYEFSSAGTPIAAYTELGHLTQVSFGLPIGIPTLFVSQNEVSGDTGTPVLQPGSGEILIAPFGNNTTGARDVLEVNPSSGTVQLGIPSVMSPGAIGPAQSGMEFSSGTAFDRGSGKLFVADQANGRVLVYQIAQPLPPAPTLGTWALLLCGLMLGVAGYAVIRRHSFV